MFTKSGAHEAPLPAHSLKGQEKGRTERRENSCMESDLAGALHSEMHLNHGNQGEARVTAVPPYSSTPECPCVAEVLPNQRMGIPPPYHAVQVSLLWGWGSIERQKMSWRKIPTRRWEVMFSGSGAELSNRISSADGNSPFVHCLIG